MPDPPPLNLQVLHKRRLDTYEEWKIEYTVESAEMMPAIAGRKVPAYLLIPTNGKPPYPAVVANHQCYQDCDIGKDAVVGKAHLRPDQVYAFELVLRSCLKTLGEPKARASRAWARRLNRAISWRYGPIEVGRRPPTRALSAHAVPRRAQPRDGHWGF